MSSAAMVSASVAVEITVSASGSQNGLCSDGSLYASPPAALHLSCGVPPTQKIRLSILLSASQKRLKSSPPTTDVDLGERYGAKSEENKARARAHSISVLKDDGVNSD